MNPEQWSKIADALGGAASQVWALASRQAAVDALASMLVVTTCLAVIFVYLRYLAQKARGEWNDDDDVILFLGSVVALGALTLAVMFGYGVLTYVVNPDWATLKQIAELIS